VSIFLFVDAGFTDWQYLQMITKKARNNNEAGLGLFRRVSSDYSGMSVTTTLSEGLSGWTT
jgi:hypothetical protein